jgi:hypothetical protein
MQYLIAVKIMITEIFINPSEEKLGTNISKQASKNLFVIGSVLY